MPKERVLHGRVIPKDEGDGTEALPTLDVHWQREGRHVQVAIELPTERWIEIADDLRNTDNVTARAIFTDAMTREQINHTIRTLRRARGSAYGADE